MLRSQVFLLPAIYMYHRVHDRRAGQDNDGWSFAAVLERHSVHPLRKLLTIAVVLNTVYIAADYLWFTALGMVSVTAGTSIANTAPFFVFLFSMCFLHEKPTWAKLGAVLMSFTGVTLIALYQDGSTQDAQTTSLVACVLVVIQTMMVSAYSVGYCVLVGEDTVDPSTVLTLTGLCGIVTIPVWIAGSLVLAASPQPFYEPLGWPDSGLGLFLLGVSGSLAGAYTLLQSFALCWTSPLLTTVGGMLTILLSLLWDASLNHREFSWQCLLGAVLVMVGFGVQIGRAHV